MKKKGFTLIELLAVIVILAVIALIAVPIVLNIIERSRKSAAKTSALNYMKAVETYLVSSKLDRNAVQLKNNETYNCTENTIIDGHNYLAINDLVEMKGYIPTGSQDKITINNKNEIVTGSLTVNGYSVNIKDKEIASIVKGPHIKVTGLSLNYSEQTMEKGSTFELKPVFTPKDASDQRVTYSSSDTSVATVTDTGIVKAIKNGNAKIIVTSKEDTSKKAECNITVITSAKSVSIEPTSKEIEVGKTVQLTGTIEPGDVTTNALTWTSSNPNVASVDENGLVIGMSAGSATITAKTVNGKIATSAITVKLIEAESVSLNKTSATIKINNTLQLSATINPNNTTDKTLTWTSSNTSIATVSNTGLVTAKAVGSATITVKTNNNKSATASITAEPECEYTVNQQFNFAYTGGSQTFTPKCTGKYKLEVWGAQGGINSNSSSHVPGKGGYSYGTINLSDSININIYVGGQGNKVTGTGTTSGGFNGGGSNTNSYGSANSYNTTGGGATDIRIASTSLYARVIVAGGGGGASNGSSSYSATGGSGGGTTGTSISESTFSYGVLSTSGTQTSGGTGGYWNSYSQGANGSFGQGGNANPGSNGGAAGGGGWYGGGAGTWCSGGGGSGYVYTSSTASNYPSGCLLNSSYYLTNAQTIAGNQTFKAPSGTSETGHAGNGYARITYLGK